MKNLSLKKSNFKPIGTFIRNVDIEGGNVIRVVKDTKITEIDEPTYARFCDLEFQNGTIEVQVRSRLLEDNGMNRGFAGVAFRIDEENTGFEAFYIRPTNARCNDQVRRNHTTQYFSFPDYKFIRFRDECPSKYESYADMGLGEWIDLRIEVDGECAKLYINNSTYPALLVNDLKHGADAKGAIGLWVDVGTEAFFRNLKIVLR